MDHNAGYAMQEIVFFATTVHNTAYKHRASLIEWFPVFRAIKCVAVSRETPKNHIADVSQTFSRKYKQQQFAFQGQLKMAVTSTMSVREERLTPVCILYFARR